MLDQWVTCIFRHSASNLSKSHVFFRCCTSELHVFSDTMPVTWVSHMYFSDAVLVNYMYFSDAVPHISSSFLIIVLLSELTDVTIPLSAKYLNNISRFNLFLVNSWHADSEYAIIALIASEKKRENNYWCMLILMVLKWSIY
jgi:hypothetical protein